MTDAAKTSVSTMTAKHLARTVALWSEYAGEPVTLDDTLLGKVIGEAITAFGSEIACLRLHYRLTTGRVAYSTNLKTWYYVNK